jgi:hypothetical protein
MEVLKSERIITPIKTPESLSFSNDSVYLWVIHANKIPPHLGISIGTLFYSLKANGKAQALSVDKIIPILERKHVTTVFYELKKGIEIVEPETVFSTFETTIPGEVTCLEPIKAIFGNKDATWLKELLSFLEGRESLRAAYGWHLPHGFSGIPDYNPADIHNRLRELDNV